MKKTVFLIFAIITFQSCGTYQKISASDLSKEAIYDNLNKSQTDLYIIANDWMIDAFNNADSVIQFSDKEEGTIIGKYYLYGNMQTIYGSVIDNRIFAKISIQLKDNRAKINVTPTTDITVYAANITVKLRNDINTLVTSFESRITANNSTVW